MHLSSSSGVPSLPPACLNNLIGSVHFSSELTTTANQTHLRSNPHLLHLSRACELDIPWVCVPVWSTQKFLVQNGSKIQLLRTVFSSAWKYLQQKPVIPALPLGELVQEINKDHLTQSEGMFSLALEVRKAGNDL